MKGNIFVPTSLPIPLQHAPLLRRLIKTAHARKGKNFVASNAKKIFFKYCRKFKTYFLVCVKISYFLLHFYKCTFPLWFIKLHSYIMSNKAKLLTLVRYSLCSVCYNSLFLLFFPLSPTEQIMQNIILKSEFIALK